ncbi:MAG: hypothetical protein GY708_24085 [Actinomycetia bacterium]|nr:hypothetical protein [Actinomycetes bacterium]
MVADRGLRDGSSNERLSYRLLWVAAAVGLVVLIGGLVVMAQGNDPVGTAGPVDALELTDEQVAAALELRTMLINQTGPLHLSMSDYAAITEVACGGAVNDPDALVELSRDWGLGRFGDDSVAANAIWMGARQVCPSSFDVSNTAPPLDGRGAASVPPSVSLTEPPVEFGDFVDTSVLESQDWVWSEGERLWVSSGSTVDAASTAAHFLVAFDSSATVNNMVGPIDTGQVAGGGATLWSIDVDVGEWNGTVEIMGPVDGNGSDSVYVLIALAPAP